MLPEGGLNLRMGASRDSGVILTLPQGTMLSVTGTEMGGMLPVMLGGLTGYVASEYVFAATDAQLGLVSATPAPTATPVPTQAPWQGLAIVTARSGLKLREQADTASRTITAMPVGATVTVTGAQVNGFYPVSYGGLSGYASASYLSLEQQTQGYIPTPAATAAPTPMPTAAPTQVPPPSQVITGRTATVIAASGLNMRADSSTYADVVATLAYGVEVVVTGESIAGFYPVRVGTLSGYVSADYLRFGETIVQQAATPEPTAAPQPGTYRVVVDSENGLNLRAAPYTGSQVVYVLPYGMVLTVLGEGENGFLHVQWAGYTGYVSLEYVTPIGAQ